MGTDTRSRLIAALVLAALATVIAGHLGFLIRDPRLPRDLGLYYSRVPALYQALDSPIAGARALMDAAGDPGGGYQALLATYLRVVGRGPLAFQLVDVAWLTALLVLAWRLARRAWGEWAGLAAVLLAGAIPAVFVYARTAWIHVPEATLLLAVVLVWQADPRLERRGTAALGGLAGAAVLLLRPSALIWIGLLLGLAAWRARRERPNMRHAAAVLVAWGLCTLPPLLSLDDYLQAKLEARARYAVAVPGLGEQLFVTVGPVAGGIAVLGALATLWPPPRRHTPLLWLWTLAPVLLFALFRAGIDNFTIAAVTLALLGAAGLGRRPALGLPLAALAFTLAQVPQWLPPPAPGTWTQHLAGRLGLALKPSFRNPYVPHRAGHGEAVGALLAATCPPESGRCLVAVDQGLFQPFAEDPGALEIFLGGYDTVEIVPLAGQTAPPAALPIRGLAHYACPEMDEKWRERHPESLDTLRALGKTHDLQPVWSADVGEGCRFTWLVPEGTVAAPDLLPAQRGGDPDSPPELPPPPMSPTRPPMAADGDASGPALGGVLARAVGGSLADGDREVLADFVGRVQSRGGIWRREVVALSSTDGGPFSLRDDLPPLAHSAAPEAVLGDDGRIYLFTVDTNLDELLRLADSDPLWFASHGLPGPGALRLHVSEDGAAWREIEEFAVEGLVGAAVLDPAVTRMDDGSWRLYYVGLPLDPYLQPQGPGAVPEIPLHVATSRDLIHWTHLGTAARLGAPGAAVYCDEPPSCTLLCSGIERWTSDDGGLTFERAGAWENRGFGPHVRRLPDGRVQIHFDAEAEGFPVLAATREDDGSWSPPEPVLDALNIGAVTVVDGPDGISWMFAERGLGPPGSVRD